MAPTKPAARRGRLSKAEAGAETQEDKATSAANGAEPVKRRGRPPKEDGAKVTKPKPKPKPKKSSPNCKL